MRPAFVASNETASRAGPRGRRAPGGAGRHTGAALGRAVFACAVAALGAARPRAASAAEGDACVSAYEGAQEARRAGQIVRARSELRLCQRSCPAALARDCAGWLPDVEARVASLRLEVRGPGGGPGPRARVLVDRQPLPEGAALAGPWELDPGPHAVLVEGVGARPERRDVFLRNGENFVLRLALSPAPDAPPPPAGRPARATPPAAYAAGGLGAVALGAGAFLVIKGHLDAAGLRDRCAPLCAQREVDAIGAQWTAGALLAGAGALALGAALWLALSGPGEAAPARPTGGAAAAGRLGWTAGGALVRF